MTRLPIDHATVIEQLEGTPRRIAAATGSLGDSELNWKPSADSWPVNEVLAHLRACGGNFGLASPNRIPNRTKFQDESRHRTFARQRVDV